MRLARQSFGEDLRIGPRNELAFLSTEGPFLLGIPNLKIGPTVFCKLKAPVIVAKLEE